jgi:hypothetical protein
MKRIYLLVVVFIIVISLKAQDFKLNEILDSYYSVNGFDKLQNVKTVTMTGIMNLYDNMPLQIVRVRPNKYIMIYDVQDITNYQAYDGNKFWVLMPQTGNAKPQLIPEERAKDFKARADFDGIIYNWKAKGHSAELIGNDTVNKVPVFKVKLTRQDGAIEYYFIGCTDFLLHKKQWFRMIRGKETIYESYYTDYKNIEGILFAFTVENRTVGFQYPTYYRFDSIELNKNVDEKIFEFPIK